MTRILLIATLALLGACASTTPTIKLYDGAERPASELVTVQLPMQLEVIMINDRRVDAGGALFTYGDRHLTFVPGSYRIVASYKELWQLTADEHEVVKSDPALFTVDGNAGDVFRIDYDRPDDVEAARAMADDFSGYVENIASGERVAGEPSGLVLNQGFISVITAGAVSDVSEAPATSVAPQSAASSPEVAAPVASVAAPSTAPASSELPLLDLLKAQWSQATAEERRAFLQWVSQPAQ